MIKTIYAIPVAIAIIVLLGVLYFSGISNIPTPYWTSNETIVTQTIDSTPMKNNLLHIIRTTGPIYVNATVYVSSDTLPVYHGVFEENGSINLKLKPIFGLRRNVTTEKDAPFIAKTVMEPYGGLPEDAIYGGAKTSYDELINLTSGKFELNDPIFTTVFYHWQINGMQVIGNSNSIVLTLGSDGELLRIVKEWRDYTYIGDVPIIPVEEAIEKLEREELLNSWWHPEEGDVTIDAIGLGYYANDIGNSETQLEPVWMMFGSGKTGNRLPFYVYARKFAGFTATPTVATASEEITFRDTSDASPSRWFWEFGDGMNSTRKHPSHTYSAPGTYNVSLRVWNDLGSDTVMKQLQVI